jgi:hypothetical protein
MSRPEPPLCPTCRGLGWYQAPVYSDFEPRMDLVACPDCNAVEGNPRGCLLWTVALVGFLTFICWVAA